MKKMLLTYSLVLCFMHITIDALSANPLQKTFSNNSISARGNGSIIKKAVSLPFDTKTDNVAGNLLRQAGPRFVNGVSYSLPVEERTFQLILRLAVKETVQRVEVERVLKDYLLHIFPSHYFW